MSIWIRFWRLRLSRRIKLDKQPDKVLVNSMLVDLRTVSSISAGLRFKSSENFTHPRMKFSPQCRLARPYLRMGNILERGPLLNLNFRRVSLRGSSDIRLVYWLGQDDSCQNQIYHGIASPSSASKLHCSDHAAPEK